MQNNFIIGQPFCKLFDSINIFYHGSKPTLNLADTNVDHHALCLAQARVKTPKLFLGLDDSVRPIKSPTRHYKPEERKFIAGEIKDLLKHGVIR